MRTFCVLVMVVTLLGSPAMAQKRAKGFMEPSCAFVGNSVIAIHLPRLPGKPKRESLTLIYFPADESKKPVPVEGSWCTGPQQCETTIDGEIVFEKVSKYGASGNYHIRFHDGHEESGKFSAERRTPNPPVLCE